MADLVVELHSGTYYQYLGAPVESEKITDTTGSVVTTDDRQFLVVTNVGSTTAWVAVGTTPSTSAEAKTSDTSARFALMPGDVRVIGGPDPFTELAEGSKVACADYA